VAILYGGVFEDNSASRPYFPVKAQKLLLAATASIVQCHL
jgi:hypothetical protein